MLAGCGPRASDLVRPVGMPRVGTYVLVASDPAPRVPQGFRTVPCNHGLSCQVLVPPNWHHLVTDWKGTVGVFVARESLEPPVPWFQTGLTVNVIQQVSRKAHLSPARYAEQYLERKRSEARSSHDPVVRTPSHDLWIVGLTTELAGPHDPEPVRRHHRVIANEATDTVYLVDFEAPVSQWSEAWPLGRVLLDHLAIDLRD